MADRRTGNLVGYAVAHGETRPVKDERMADPHRHIHVELMNVTYDRTEKEWKAIKMRPMMELRKYVDRRFNLRLSHKLAELGYGIESKWQRGGRGGRKYMGWGWIHETGPFERSERLVNDYLETIRTEKSGGDKMAANPSKRRRRSTGSTQRIIFTGVGQPQPLGFPFRQAGQRTCRCIAPKT